MPVPAAVTDASLARELRAIRDLWPALLNAAKDATAGTAGDPARPPVGIAALSLRREVAEVLTSDARMVLDELAPVDDAPDPRTVDTTDGAGLASWLIAYAVPLAEHPAAGDLQEAWTALAGRMESVAQGAKRARLDVGHACPELVDGEPCAGTLRSVVRYDEPSESVVSCTVAGAHRWTVDEWPQLVHRITPGGLALVTAREAAALLDVTDRTVRRWIADERLRTYPDPAGGYRVDYLQAAAIRGTVCDT